MSYIKTLETISARRGSASRIFADFVRLAACSLAPRVTVDGRSVSVREAEYMETIGRYDAREASLFQDAFHQFIEQAEREDHRDVLGRTYIEWAANCDKKARGEFYTPPEVSELLATMTIDAPTVIAEGRAIRICEPACGAGGMILATAKLFAPDHWHLPRFTAIDINPTACDMAFINTTLWSVPCEVICGNALFPKATDRRMVNLHWLRCGEEQIRLFRQLLRPPETTSAPAGAPPAPAVEKPFYEQADLFAA